MDEQIEKYFQGQLSSEQALLLMRKVESDEKLKKQFIECQNLNALLALAPHEDDHELAKRELGQFIRKQQSRKYRLILLRVSGYAAAIALLIGITWWVTSTNLQHKQLAEVINKMYVPAGQRACITLSDGTEVWLNSQSTLIYPSLFTEKERRVTLTGEAFFDVAKVKNKPFIVNTQKMNIKVLGTKFNVYAYPDAELVQTSLVKGRLKVCSLGKSNKSITLESNQEVIYKNGEMKVQSIRSGENFSWREGVYYFNKEPFIDIIRKLELYYDVKIIVETPSILNIVYRGKFRQRDGIIEILQIIQKIHKFRIEKNDNVIILK